MSRTSMWRSLWVGCGAILLVGASPTLLGASSREDQAALEEANHRWRGARCRTRQQLTVKKARDGWSDCKWLFWSPERGNSRVKVEVSDGAAVHRAFRGGVVPVGTELVAAGWFVEEGGSDLYLELELAGHPVRARVFFYDDWVGRVSVKRLDDFERWARFDFLEVVSVPSERLVEVPAVPVASRPAATAAPAAAPAAAVTGEVGPPSVEVLAVAAQPARVAPGGEIAMVITYEVRGVPPGSAFEVLELREVFHGERRLVGFEERLPRASDTYTSKQPLRLPADVAPGLYSLRAKVVMAGREATGSALFEVQSGR